MKLTRQLEMAGWIVLLLFSFACSDDSGTPSTGGDTDTEMEAGENAEADVLDCPPYVEPQYEVDLQQKKFAVNLLHFNLQYVAGGLEGYDDTQPDIFNLDEQETEDLIIRESFVPVVDFYDEHPDWHVTLEMQGYMVEAVRDRFPDTMLKLRNLVEEGRAEIVSWHYSDQLFLAYPKRAMEWSIARNDQALRESCLPRRGSVFTQEGQFGEGMVPLMKENDYRTGLYAMNLLSFFTKPFDGKPWFDLHGIDIVICEKEVHDTETGIDLVWTFFDDGELMATGMLNPYMLPYFQYNPDAMDTYAKELTDLETEGYKHVTISEYVAHLEAQNIAKPTLPTVLDGTWHPKKTDDFFLWMGGKEGAGDEQDNHVLATNVQAYHKVLAAETALAAYPNDALQDDFNDAVRELLFAHCSDSTGWRPWRKEVEYSLSHAEAAKEAAGRVLEGVRDTQGWEHIRVDNSTGEVVGEMIFPEAPDAVDPLFDIPTESAREMDVSWYSHGDNVREVRVEIAAVAAPTSDETDRVSAMLTMPYSADDIIYSPGLIDAETVHYAREDFWFEGYGYTHLPLHNGLLGLGGDRWLILDTSVCHLAPRIPNKEDTVAPDSIQIIDNSLRYDRSDSWAFYILTGTEQEAIDFAVRKNVKREWQE